MLALRVTVVYGALQFDNVFGMFDHSTVDILGNIEEYGAKKAYEASKLLQGSYIEMVNSELVVIDQYKSIHEIGYKYPYTEFRELETDNSFQYQIYYFTEMEEENIVLTYNPKYPKNEEEAQKLFKKILIRIITIFIISVFLVLLIYAKFTSKTMVIPIKKIIEGVKTISSGYSGENTTLKLKLEAIDNKAILIIKDNGIGIPAELCMDIFEPFVRADNSRNSKTGGTGLGLGITKAIIEKHEGSVELDTSFKEGCRFVISLPMKSSIKAL